MPATTLSDTSTALAATRANVDDMLKTVHQSDAFWNVPRAPGKWSPSQVVEHVALAMEETVNDLLGRPSKFPKMPTLLRPLVRTVLFNRVVRNGKFPKAKTNAAMTPAKGPESPAAASTRMATALATLEAGVAEARARGKDCTSQTFGAVSVADYVIFQAVHVKHHHEQKQAQARASARA